MLERTLIEFCLKYIYIYTHTHTHTHCTGAEEDVEHVFFHCPRFLEDRERALGERPSRDSIVGLMLESEEKLVVVGIAATNIMKELRQVERQRAGEIQEP